MLEPVSKETIGRAIEILGCDNLDEEQLTQELAKLVEAQVTATRLRLFIPEAFGTVIISHFPGVTFSDHFSVKTKAGVFKDFPLSIEPIFAEAFLTGQSMYHSDEREKSETVASISSVVSTASQALEKKMEMRGFKFSPIAYLGIPAEIYSYSPPAKPSFWRILKKNLFPQVTER